MNALCDLLGISIPILQAPTASIAGPELAGAVSAAGGLGAMGLTWTPPDQAVASVKEVLCRCGGHPFLANFVLTFPCAAFESVLDAGAPVIGFSWGMSNKRANLVKQHGARLVVQTGSREGALRAVGEGADAIVCQGSEAGGHVQSSTPLDRLLSEVLEAVGGQLPVIAAGGIATGSEIRHWLRKGASGVMIGTRFVATQESRAHPEYKTALLRAAPCDTSLTVCFDGGWPQALHRVLRNETFRVWEAAGCPLPGQRPGEGQPVAWSQSGEAILRYEDTAPREGMTGRVGEMALYAGTGVGDIRDLPSAGELLRRLWSDASAPGGQDEANSNS